MKKIVVFSLALLLISSTDLIAGQKSNQGALLPPFQNDTYGPGINSDATGRPSTWQTNDGQSVPPGTKVKPNVYGPGIGQDEFGRPVKPKVWP